MKTTPALLLLLLAVGFFSACGLLGPKEPETSAVTSLSDTRLQAKFPGYTLTEYQAGEALFQTQCTRCHAPYLAPYFSETAWSAIIPKMAAKANNKAGGEVVTLAGEQAIFRYLYAQGMAVTPSDH